MKIRAPVEIIYKNGQRYVQETIKCDGEVMGTTIEHAPFLAVYAYCDTLEFFVSRRPRPGIRREWETALG